GTELLDRFGRVQVPDRKGAVEKDRRKSSGTSLRPEAPNEPGIEGGNGNLCSCSAKRTYESASTFKLKGPGSICREGAL
ncbi:hypothetical protein ALC56_00502, partial [Trachymyrmex septentrionalis]